MRFFDRPRCSIPPSDRALPLEPAYIMEINNSGHGGCLSVLRIDDKYLELAVSTVESLSRTSHGFSATSSNPAKRTLLKVGPSLSKKSHGNLCEAIRWANRGLDDAFAQSEDAL